MTIFHLENNLKNAKSLSKIEGVYWSARDMDPSPVGSHHFITFVYNSKEQAIKVTRQWGIDYKSEQNDKDLTVFFTTMGAGKSGKNIIINFNPSSDLKAIHEIAKKDNTSWCPDYDYEGHRVPYNFSSNNYASSEELMNAILQRVSNFNKCHYAGITVDYSLVDRNCATLVNSIFKVLGYAEPVRKEIGEFVGVDWGEEDLISDGFFDDIGYFFIGNGSTKELHIPSCYWVSRMKEENKMHFPTIGEALNKGYNGCYYCLKKYDDG